MLVVFFFKVSIRFVNGFRLLEEVCGDDGGEGDDDEEDGGDGDGGVGWLLVFFIVRI